MSFFDKFIKNFDHKVELMSSSEQMRAFSSSLEQMRVFSPSIKKEDDIEKATYLCDMVKDNLSKTQALEQIIQNDVYYDSVGSDRLSDVSPKPRNIISLSKICKQFK